MPVSNEIEIFLYFAAIVAAIAVLLRSFSNIQNRQEIMALKERNVKLSVRITSLQAANIALQYRLTQATDHIIVYSVLENELKTLQERLDDVERQYAESVRELSFWRAVRSVDSAADGCRDLMVRYGNEIATFESVIAWVEHLKLTIEELKSSTGGKTNGD